MTDRLITGDFMPADSLADNEIEFFSLNVPRPGGQHVGMYIAPIVAVHRATGISVTVSDVERSQMATKKKAEARLMAVLTRLRSHRPQLTESEREALVWLRWMVNATMNAGQFSPHDENTRLALAVLDRLIGGAK